MSKSDESAGTKDIFKPFLFNPQTSLVYLMFFCCCWSFGSCLSKRALSWQY